VRFWLIAAVVSAAAHVCFAAWVDGHAPARRTPPPPIVMELAQAPKPPPRVLPPPPPPPVVPPPKKPIVVKKLAIKPQPAPADPTPPPPETAKLGVPDDGPGDVAVNPGTPDGDPDGTADKAPPAPPAPPPPAPAKPKSQFVPIYQVTRLPHAKHAVAPEIPEAFRQANREAQVVIEVELDAQGHVTGARVIRHGEFGLDEAALAAAKQTEFEPALVGTQPVPVRFQIPYRFRVRG
jgi:protein TonB